MIRIAFFDMGKKNFGQYIEDASLESLQDLNMRYKSLPKKEQRKTKGELVGEMKDIHTDLIKSSEALFIGNFDLRTDDEEKKVTHDVRRNIIGHLEKYKKWWDTCDLFVIEQQFFRSGPFQRFNKGGANIDAIKISELVYTWFLTMYPELQEMEKAIDIVNKKGSCTINVKKGICFFGSTYKTQIMGAPEKMKDKERKVWAIQKAIEICKQRGDNKILTLLTTDKKRGEKVKKGENQMRIKKDDGCDCLVGTQAFKLKYLVACF